jgi:hypothetical protein
VTQTIGRERQALKFRVVILQVCAHFCGTDRIARDIMRRHNDEANDFHFSDPHAVICIGNVAEADSGRELFINLTTAWNVLNLGRGLASG